MHFGSTEDDAFNATLNLRQLSFDPCLDGITGAAGGKQWKQLKVETGFWAIRGFNFWLLKADLGCLEWNSPKNAGFVEVGVADSDSELPMIEESIHEDLRGKVMLTVLNQFCRGLVISFT